MSGELWEYHHRAVRELRHAKLSIQAAARLNEAMLRVSERRTRAGDVHHLDGPICEVRVRDAERQYRLLFCYLDDAPPVALALRAFVKKTATVPRKDIDLAKERRTIWLDARR